MTIKKNQSTLLRLKTASLAMENENPMSDAQSEKDTVEIGIIGMGDMGRLYARRISAAGWKQLSGHAG